jgi:opacity protein-like surface antigen
MKKILAVVLLSASAVPAFAVDLAGFYAGATLGAGNANFSAPAAPAAAVTVENPKSKPVYGVFGGYHYNKNLAVEVAYTGASYIYTTPAAGARTLNKQIVIALTAVGTLPVSDSVSVIGKLGVASASSENNAVAGEQNTSRFAPTFGAGVEYKITPVITGRLGVDVYGVAATISQIKQTSNATVVNAGVSYAF